MLAGRSHRNAGASLPPALCIAIHDVAPSTWPLCARLLQAVEAVARVPVTLLVVPHYHRLPVAHPLLYERQLERRIAGGDELALHGYTHLDEGPVARHWRERFWREVFTLREGEFAALVPDEARRRLLAGMAWFEQRGWPVTGFVAPAWLLGSGTTEVIGDLPFRYTTTLGRFLLLPECRSVPAPSLLYSSRNAAGRWLSRWASATAATMYRDAPLLRLALHPNDAMYPALVRHCQRLVARLLRHRTPMTKATFAERWMATQAALAGPGGIRSDWQTLQHG